MTAFKLVISEVHRTGDASGGCLKCLTVKRKDYGKEFIESIGKVL